MQSQASCSSRKTALRRRPRRSGQPPQQERRMENILVNEMKILKHEETGPEISKVVSLPPALKLVLQKKKVPAAPWSSLENGEIRRALQAVCALRFPSHWFIDQLQSSAPLQGSPPTSAGLFILPRSPPARRVFSGPSIPPQSCHVQCPRLPHWPTVAK
ncbi:hypothetical protein PAPYR_5051 [Paratrimastix pyriformis]|uniref:Uncharacterized protein n=1 Tax=Paratrimastix pyriformis TaxID=342808 RepID=A0ABQ8UMR5_9EUKA|nr:hypothetical protein PAPYR_5051 [Paratrimastix pyriformis]